MRRAYAIGMALAVGLLFVGSLWFSVAYTRQVDQRSADRQAQQRDRQDRRWCSLLGKLDQPGVPATTPRGQAVQQDIHQLRIDLGCEGR